MSFGLFLLKNPELFGFDSSSFVSSLLLINILFSLLILLFKKRPEELLLILSFSLLFTENIKGLLFLLSSSSPFSFSSWLLFSLSSLFSLLESPKRFWPLLKPKRPDDVVLFPKFPKRGFFPEFSPFLLLSVLLLLFPNNALLGFKKGLEEFPSDELCSLL